MFKKIKKIFTISSIMFFLLVPNFGLAQGIKNAGSNLNNAIVGTGLEEHRDLATEIGGIIKAILGLVGTIFMVLVVYAGILWMTAQGDKDQVEKSKTIVKNSTIGLAIVASAYLITNFITSLFNK